MLHNKELSNPQAPQNINKARNTSNISVKMTYTPVILSANFLVFFVSGS